MHGTGTSLGDPVESGAAAAVFSKAHATQSELHFGFALQERLPLGLMASKSWTGHAEPASGLVGILRVHAALVQSQTLPVLHLGVVNPYVASSLENGQSSRPWAIPRQAGGLPEDEAFEARCGVSSFAFQVRYVLPLQYIINIWKTGLLVQ